MKDQLHDEPAPGLVSQEEYDYALKHLRDFQQMLASRYAKHAKQPLTLESIEVD